MRNCLAHFSANPEQAEFDLNRFLDSLLAAPPDGGAYFRLLEHARPIALSAKNWRKRYLNKPLPLGDIEERFFQQVVTLWIKVAKAYAHSAEGFTQS